MTTTTGSCERDGMRLVWAAATHVGNVRHHNEDGFLAAPGLFVVADGMGGHEAGEVASALVLEVCREYAAKVPLAFDAVSELVEDANDRVFRHASETGPMGMGTTLVGVALVHHAGDGTLIVFNVGDSRAYLLAAEAGLIMLTHDHSVVQELIDDGRLDEADAAHHPERNVVTRAVGIEPVVVGDFMVVPRSERGRLLLCSDGVSGQLDHGELAALLSAAPSPGAAVAGLLERVLEGTAPDNATAVVVDVERRPSETLVDNDNDNDNDTASADDTRATPIPARRSRERLLRLFAGTRRPARRAHTTGGSHD